MAFDGSVMVTGGAGYIGSHCCRALDAAGYRPVTYDNLSTGHRSFAAGTLVVGDIADKAKLARTFAEHDIVAVMHFAASSLVGESVADPQKYYINNLAGTLSLLQTMREAGCHALTGEPEVALRMVQKLLREEQPARPATDPKMITLRRQVGLLQRALGHRDVAAGDGQHPCAADVPRQGHDRARGARRAPARVHRHHRAPGASGLSRPPVGAA